MTVTIALIVLIFSSSIGAFVVSIYDAREAKARKAQLLRSQMQVVLRSRAVRFNARVTGYIAR